MGGRAPVLHSPGQGRERGGRADFRQLLYPPAPVWRGLTVFCLAFRRPILYLFGASDLTFPYANDYLTIYLLGTLFVMIGLGMNPFINAQGFSRMGMMTVALGAAVNIVLDPIFILPWIWGCGGRPWPRCSPRAVPPCGC